MATSLEIPQTFLNDIQSRNPQIIPLIHIELNGETLKFSTVPLTVRDNITTHNGIQQVEVPTNDRPYLPLLLNIPKISQSIDFFNKKFKTSSMNLDFSDLTDFFSDPDTNIADKLFDKKVKVYFKSQSTRFDSPDYTHTEALSYCYYAYDGFITEVNIKNDVVSIEIEDATEKAAKDTNIPYIANEASASNKNIQGAIPDRSIGNYLPYVFGYVDHSPCVVGGERIYTGAVSTKKTTLSPLDVPDNVIIDYSQPIILKNEGLIDITSDITEDLAFSTLSIYDNGFRGLSYTDTGEGSMEDSDSNFKYEIGKNYISFNPFEGNLITEDKVFAFYERKKESVAFTSQQEGCFLTNSMTNEELEIDGVFNASPYSGTVDSYPYINFADTPENELSYTGLNDNIVETGGRGKFAKIFFEDSFSSAVNIGADIYLKIKGTVVVDNIGDSDTNVFGDDIEYQYPSNRLSLIGFRTSNYSATQIISPDDSFAPLGVNDNIDLTKDVDGTVTDIQGFESLVDTNAIYSFTHDSLFGEHEKFTIESDSTSVDNKNNFINLGFYGQFNNDNFGDYSQKYAHTLDIYGIRVVAKAVIEEAREKDYFVRRFGFDFGEGYLSTAPHRILDFLAQNDLLIPTKKTGRHSIEHLDSLYLREWYASNDSLFFTPAIDSRTEDHNGAISREANGDFNYSFSLNKKTNIKQFIEDFSLETNLMPMIDKGELKFIAVEDSVYNDLEYTSGSTISDITTTVEANDVINYSYKKTPIDEVVNRLTLKYKKNYGSNDYEHKMDSVDASSIFPNYDMSFYSLREKVIELDYIREGSTAKRFGKYYLANYCNQRLQINMTLPLKYLYMNVGDLLRFDDLLGSDNKKPYGIDYSKDFEGEDFANIINGQPAWGKFLVTKINKNLDKISITCLQVHDTFSQNIGNLGCMDKIGDVVHYDGDSETPSGSYQVIISPENFDPDANVNANNCNHVAGCADPSDNVDPSSYGAGSSPAQGVFYTPDDHPNAGQIVTLNASAYWCKYQEDIEDEFTVIEYGVNVNNGSNQIFVGTNKSIGFYNASDDSTLIFKHLYEFANSANNTITIDPYLKIQNTVNGNIYEASSFGGSNLSFGNALTQPFEIYNDQMELSVDVFTPKGAVSQLTQNTINALNIMFNVEETSSGGLKITYTRPPWAFKDDGTIIEYGDVEYPYMFNPNWMELWSNLADQDNKIPLTIKVDVGSLTTESGTVSAPASRTFNFSLFLGAPQQTPWVFGDINFDGVLNENDLSLMSGILGQEGNDASLVFADLDGNGIIDEDDYALLEEIISTNTYEFSDSINFGSTQAHIYNPDEHPDAFNNQVVVTSTPFHITTPSGTSTLEFAVYDTQMESWFCKIAKNATSISELTEAERNVFIWLCNLVNNQNNNGNDLREFVQRAVNVYGNQHLSNTFNQAIYLEGFDAAWQGLYANTPSICKKLQTFTANKTAESSNDTIFPFTTFTYEFKVQKRGNDSVYNFHNFCLGGTKLLIQRPDKNHYSVVPFAYYISDQIILTGGTITLEDIIFNIDFTSFTGGSWFPFGG